MDKHLKSYSYHGQSYPRQIWNFYHGIVVLFFILIPASGKRSLKKLLDVISPTAVLAFQEVHGHASAVFVQLRGALKDHHVFTVFCESSSAGGMLTAFPILGRADTSNFSSSSLAHGSSLDVPLALTLA